jgi:flagellar biosynthesis protein FlhF
LRLVREIEFEAKNENEAFSKVKARLGSDGIILSMQNLRTASMIPFLRKSRVVVRAGILEEEKKLPPRPDPDLEKKRMEVFQALLLHRKNGDNESASAMAPSITILEQKTPGKPGIPEDTCPELAALVDHEIPQDCAEKLREEYGRLSGQEGSFPSWLERKADSFCACPEGDSLVSALGGRKVMIVGPTGAGKTTTIAKIAAMAVMDGMDVALFTSDNFRVSAVDQIRTFARVLGIPVEVVNQGSEIPGLLQKYSPDTIILMDTAGCGFRDDERMAAISEICRYFEPDAVHMTISCPSRARDVQAAMDTARRTFPLSRIILTKLDETVCMGASIWLPMKYGLPLSFLTTGQNVPRDLHLATGSMIVSFLFKTGVPA